MSLPANTHPDPAVLAAFAAGRLPDDAAELLCRHLDTCPACAALADRPPEDELTQRLRQRGATDRRSPAALDTTLLQALAPSAGAPGPARLTVPGYELLGELGRGGMGVVYKVRQVALNRLVALKMIRGGASASADELARFRSEALALARLQHPNIVQVFEVGEADGLPYFAMEYVAGGSLGQVAAGRPQPPRDAAALVETLAHAVHAAHVAGVVHRDLKPGNILLASGVASAPRGLAPVNDFANPRGADATPLADFIPKIADFGLAKWRERDAATTASGAIVGTVGYMAPEQAAGRIRDVGPAADVHALGAILYELLTGRPPFLGETALATLEQVLDVEPVPPGRLQPGVPRDLETVCLKCLHKSPRGRYPTAQELADDLGRLRAGEPVRARPVGNWERVGRWARRRPAVAGLLAGIVAVTVLGFAGVTWALVEARRAKAVAEQEGQEAAAQRDRARTAEAKAASEAAVARAVKEFLQEDVLEQAAAERQADAGLKPDPKLTVRAALDRAAERIGPRFAGQPLVEAEIRRTLGQTYLTLGNLPAAEAQLTRSLEIRRREEGNDSLHTAMTHTDVGQVLQAQGKYDAAEPHLVKVEAIYRRELGEDHNDTLVATNNLAMLYQRQGKAEPAEELLTRVLAALRRQRGDEHIETLTAMNNLAVVSLQRGNVPQAESLAHSALEARRRTHGDEHPLTLVSMNLLVQVYWQRGQADRAVSLGLQVLEARRRILREGHPQTLNTMQMLAELYQKQGQDDRAEPLLVEALAGRRRALGENHPDTLQTTDYLMRHYLRRGRYDQAEPLLLAAYERLARDAAADAPRLTEALERIVRLYDAWGKPDQVAAWREKLAAIKP